MVILKKKTQSSTNVFTFCYISLFFFKNQDLRNPILVYAIGFITTIKIFIQYTLRQIFIHNYSSVKQFPINQKRNMYLILFHKQTVTKQVRKLFYYRLHFSKYKTKFSYSVFISSAKLNQSKKNRKHCFILIFNSLITR